MNLKLSILSVCTIICLSGCGTRPYTPSEYMLRDGVIPTLNVKGDVVIDNTQSNNAEVLVYEYAGSNLASNYKDITQLMVEQTKKELEKNTKNKTEGTQKKIELQVTYLKSTYQIMWWKSELRYTAVLGGSDRVEKIVHHGSGNLIQDLNGCIADAVVDLLNDAKVQAYLAE